jgi:hypothetical protein
MPRYSIVAAPESVALPVAAISDRRLSATDLGVYARLTYAATMWTHPDLELLVKEFRMPREETEAALLRLEALGILEEIPDRT